MDIDEKTIQAALLKGERVTLECKKAQSNVPIDMWKTYSAFANTYGGNQCIQNIFRMIGFGENLGSGFPLILSAWNEKHWLKPELIEQRELLQVKLILSIETKEKDSLMPSNGTKEMSVVLKDVLKELSERQIVILEMIVRDPSLSAKAMSEKMSEKNTNVERTIERDLAKLKKLGILTRKGGRKNGEWVIVYSPQIESETENQ